MERFIVIDGDPSRTDANGDTYARAYGPFDYETAQSTARDCACDESQVTVVPLESVAFHVDSMASWFSVPSVKRPRKKGGA
jgi:hypothetical protein